MALTDIHELVPANGSYPQLIKSMIYGVTDGFGDLWSVARFMISFVSSKVDEVDHRRDLYCLEHARPCGFKRRRLETLGAHLLTLQGHQWTRAALQQLREIRSQTLLDGEFGALRCIHGEFINIYSGSLQERCFLRIVLVSTVSQRARLVRFSNVINAATFSVS